MQSNFEINIFYFLILVIYNTNNSKNKAFWAEAAELTAERSKEAKVAEAQKTCFAPI